MIQKRKVFITVISFVFCCLNAVLLHAESCSTVGAKQNKYTASGCSYTTTTRECCSNKTWSEWGKECSKICYQTGASKSYHYDTCSACWNAAVGMTNAVPKCAANSTGTNCYEIIQSSDSMNDSRCTNNTLPVHTNSGGSTRIIPTVRYIQLNASENAAGHINCYFENPKYRIPC